jgi:enediyne biosynthesis protein E7
VPQMHEERGLPFAGSAFKLAGAPHRFMADLALRHGGIASFRVLNRRIVVVADPDMTHELLVSKWQRFIRGRQSANLGIIGRGLLTMTGEEWFDRRRLAQAAFTRDMLKKVAHHSTESARALFVSWDSECQRDGTVSLEDGMLRVSMLVIAGMLLSTEISSADADRIGATLRRGLQLVLSRNTALWVAPIWLPTPTNRGLLTVRRELTEFITANIATRPVVSTMTSDIHQAMSDARDPRTGKGLSAEALLDETKTLFFAGYETAATGLTWTLYLLARHTQVADKLALELAAVLGTRDPTVEDLAHMPYLRAVLQEAMRVYPPVYALPRQAVADDAIGGHPIKSGTIVIASINGLHASRAWGKDRDQFLPDRFMGADWPRRAYMPFGAGRHLCIGGDFAMVEMSMAIAMVIQRYRISTESEVGTKARVTMIPDGAIRLKLIPKR